MFVRQSYYRLCSRTHYGLRVINSQCAIFAPTYESPSSSIRSHSKIYPYNTVQPIESDKHNKLQTYCINSSWELHTITKVFSIIFRTNCLWRIFQTVHLMCINEGTLKINKTQSSISLLTCLFENILCFLYIYLYCLHQLHQVKFLVSANLLGNKLVSDSDSGVLAGKKNPLGAIQKIEMSN